jgi:magnesium transporter
VTREIFIDKNELGYMMTQPSSEKLIDKVQVTIQEGDKTSLRRLIDPLRAADVADLVEHLNPEERIYLFESLEPESAGDVLVEIEGPVQEKILGDLDNQAITEIVEELDSDDAADLVGDLPEERAKQIIETLDDEVSEEIERLLPYPEDTAGGIMALEFVAVHEDDTLAQAIDVIRAKREDVVNFFYLFVLDDYGRLVGVVSLKDLVVEPAGRKIREIMNPEVISVPVHLDQEEVAKLFKKYDLVTVPVVDDNHRLVGRITHDDIIDVLEEEADEDISRMAGVIHQEIAEESSLKISRARLPWLVVGLFGGVLAAGVINEFENTLERVITLAFFFPVIMAMGGSSGTQAATVIVRGMATGDISIINMGKRLWVELRVSFINGIICGIILGIIVSLWLSNVPLGMVVAVSLVIIVLSSGFIGAAVPLILNKLHIDPALATGPFVTTLNDILSLLIYLGLITIFFTLIS